MSTDTINEQIPAGTWVLEPVHSSVAFAITHNTLTTFRSGFTSFEATLTGGESPRLDGTVEVSSIDVADEGLKEHLLAPDFFEAAKHPHLRFTSTELSAAHDGSVRLSGDLEMRGSFRPVQATGRFAKISADIVGNERLGLSLETTVDRRDFGIDWNLDLPSGVRALEDEVTIEIELQFVPQES
jgi:polyisoprenoid-binding protein YceI